MASTVVVEKILGAAAKNGMNLTNCKALGDQVIARTGSKAVALTSSAVPTAGTPTF